MEEEEKIDDFHITSIWEDPNAHMRDIEIILNKECEKLGISRDELEEILRERNKKVGELLEYKILGVNGFAGPIFLYDSEYNSNGTWYGSIFKKLISFLYSKNEH